MDGGNKKENSINSRSIIKISNVDMTFKLASGDVNVLKGINLDIKPNSFSIIYGPSGSGKSTLLNIISGLQPPTSGEVVINNSSVYKLSSDARAYFRSQTLGIVYQSMYWVKSLSVIENIAMPLYVAGYDRHIANEQALKALKQVGLEEFVNYQPTLLSGGQQQRVSMARALVAGPEIILADEPTGNLDTKNGDMIMDLLKKIQKEMDRTIVMITHNLDYLHLSDKQIHITDGQIIDADKKSKKAK
jgi:putative ABC transport system ATP-binding protein